VKSGTENIEVRMKDEGLPAGQSFVDGGSVVAEIITSNMKSL